MVQDGNFLRSLTVLQGGVNSQARPKSRTDPLGSRLKHIGIFPSGSLVVTYALSDIYGLFIHSLNDPSQIIRQEGIFGFCPVFIDRPFGA